MLTIKCPEFCPTKEMSSNQDFLSPRRALSWYIHLKGFCTKVFLRINHATTVFSVFVNQNSTNRKPNLGQRRLSFLLLTCVWGGQFPLCCLDEVMTGHMREEEGRGGSRIMLQLSLQKGKVGCQGSVSRLHRAWYHTVGGVR